MHQSGAYCQVLGVFSGAGWLDFHDRKHLPGWNTPDKTSTSILTAKNIRNINKNVTQFQFGLIPTKIFGVMIVIFGGWDPKFAFQRCQWRCKCRLRRGHSKMLRVLQTVCIEPWTAKGHSARCPTETAGCRCYESCWAGCWLSSGICVIKICWPFVVMCTWSCFGLTSTIIESSVQSLGQSDKEQSNNFCNGPIPLSNIHMNSKYEITSHRQNQDCVSKQTLAMA